MKSIPQACADLELLRDLEEISELGHGGNGRVFHVRNKSTNQEFALKWIHLDYSDDASLSDKEYFKLQKQQWDEIFSMKVLAQVDEIVSIKQHAFYTHPDGQHVDSFILMELLAPLDTLLSKQKLTIEESARLVEDVSTALTACHNAKIIHGDVKPDNILIGPDCYKLADFGVSLRLQKDKHLQPGGTLYYLPPECRQSGEATVVGDVYSFGMTLYTLFNDGLLPFQKEANAEAEEAAWKACLDLASQPQGVYPPPQHAPEAIAEVLLRATAIDSSKRYPTPKALADAYLAAVASLTEEQRKTPLPYGKHRAVYRSTRAATPNFRNNLKSRNTVSTAANSPFATQSGFDDPPVQTEIAPLHFEPVVPETPPARKKPVFLIVAISVAALAAVALGVFLLLSSLSLTITAQPDSFSAVLDIGNARGDVTLQLYAYGSGAGPVLTGSAPTMTLSPLAPETPYTVSVTSGGQTAQANFTTLPAETGRFTPLQQKIFTCDSAVVAKTANLHDLTNRAIEAKPFTGDQLTLRNTTLFAQNLSILLSCSVAYEAPAEFSDGVMLLVLRTPDDIVTQAFDVPGHTKSKPRFNLTHDFSPLFDEYFSRHHTHYQGEIRLEIYWLNELLGSADLTLTDGRQK